MEVFCVHAHGPRHIAPYRRLQRVLRVNVVVQAQAVLHAVGQKACVLAAAVVVSLIKLQPGWRRLVQQSEQPRHMAAAAQRLVGEPGFVEHVLRLCHVHVLPVVAGTQQCHLSRRQTKMRRTTCLNKGQCLQGLERGARESQPVRIANLGQHLPTGVGHGHGAKVQALGRAASAEFDQGDKVHGSSCFGVTRNRVSGALL